MPAKFKTLYCVPQWWGPRAHGLTTASPILMLGLLKQNSFPLLQANHLPSDNSVALQDVTSMFTVLTVAGPKSRDLMQQLTNSNLEMHPFTYKYVNMGYASGVLVLAVTQTGEPGYRYVRSS